MSVPDVSFMRELLVVLVASLATVYLFRRLRVPNIVGFLAAGILIGPEGFGLVSDKHTIEVLAEVGVVLLLFTIGLKISLKDLIRLRVLVFGAGGLQVAATFGCIYALAVFAGLDSARAAFLGLAIALSSTAVVLKLLEQRGESATPQGRLALSILVFQDLAIIPMMLMIPLLAGESSGWGDAIWQMARSLCMIAGIFLVALYVLPRLLEGAVRMRSREIFTLTVLLVVLGTAYLTSLTGASLAIGAFLAGVIVSESEYSAQIHSDVMPLRDALGSLFFVSVGMLVAPAQWIAQPFLCAGFVLGVLGVKATIAGVAAYAFGFGSRVAILTGFGLAQVGEFSFIMATAGESAGLLTGPLYQLFLSASVFTMALTPFVMMLSPLLAKRAPAVPWIGKFIAGGEDEQAAQALKTIKGHVIIVGCGPNGRGVARVLRSLDAPYLLLELNPVTVRELREAREPILYGDAANQHVLNAAGVKRARVLVVTVVGPSTGEVVAAARAANPDLIIIVRARFLSEAELLQRAGATQVVTEEFTSAMELLGLVMKTYGVSDRNIIEEKERLQAERFELLQTGIAPVRHPTMRALAAGADVVEVHLPSHSPAIDRSLADLALRNRFGVVVLGIDRSGVALTNPDANTELEARDGLLLFGETKRIADARAWLAPPEESDEAPPAAPRVERGEKTRATPDRAADAPPEDAPARDTATEPTARD